ncbi:hypothetical protein OUZ56_026170 [Daphnia magna]|uniref:Uncharacterized protein n=1 Tax=Daphnia magna TaxID=35525 RepID=A0ABQ9ZL33_9CRUS|nr:hypothetical protein OUZ56_026170 [Daphnia magna]
MASRSFTSSLSSIIAFNRSSAPKSFGWLGPVNASRSAGITTSLPHTIMKGRSLVDGKVLSCDVTVVTGPTLHG